MGKYFFTLLTFALPGAGAYLKQRDSNSTGADDVIGNILITLSPALDDLQNGSESKINKVLKTVRDQIDTYLTQNP